MKKIWFLFLLPVLLLDVWSCSKPSEEDRVRAVITEVQVAAGERDIVQVLDKVSKQYRDPQGNDWNGIRGLLAIYFFRHRAVSVLIPEVEVTVEGNKARAVFQTVFTGKTAGEGGGTVLPNALGVYGFEVELVKEGKEWMAVSAVWKRVGEQER